MRFLGILVLLIAGLPAKSQETLGYPLNNPTIVGDCHFGNHCYVPTKQHTAIDVDSNNESVIAAAPGTVYEVINCGSCPRSPGTIDHGLGNTVILKHRINEGFVYTLYAHMDSINPNIYEGMNINKGSTIGVMGHTGVADGDHVHFELKTSGILHNPSGSGTYYGYTPGNPSNYGYLNPEVNIGTLRILPTTGGVGGGPAQTPDLQPDRLTVSPSSSRPGATVEVDFRIKNIGTGRSNPSVAYIRLGQDQNQPPSAGAPIATISVPALDGTSGRFEDDVTFALPTNLPTGNYYIWLTVDATNTAGQTAVGRLNDHRLKPVGS